MPNNQKKRKTVPSYLLKVRRLGATSDTIINALNDLPDVKFQSFLTWNYPRYKRSNVFYGLRPNNSKQLGQWRRFPVQSENFAIRWISAISTFFSHDISNNNRYNNAVEKIGNNYPIIKRTAIEHIITAPMSFHNLSPLLFSISKTDGLEKQSQWITENLFVKPASIGNAVLYFKGIATEGGRDPVDVYENVNTSLLSRIEDNELTATIRYLLFGMPLNFNELKSVVEILGLQSAIDQYEALSNTICSNYISSFQSHKDDIAPFIKLMQDTNDWRAISLLQLDGLLDSDYIYLPLCGTPSLSLRTEVDNRHLDELNEREFRTVLADKFLYAPTAPLSYIASSHYILRYACSLAEYLQGLSRREIANTYLNGSASIFESRRKVRLTFDHILPQLEFAENEIERRELFRLICLLGINEARIYDVLLCLYDESSKSRTLSTWFPVETFLSVFPEDDIIDLATDPRIATAVSRLNEGLGDGGDNLIYLCVEEYLESCGVRRPSELTVSEVAHETFLYEACTLDRLRESLEFSSAAEVEEERLLLLRIVADHSTENTQRYENDIQEIVSRQAVDELLQRYEVGKIHCDERAIQSWALEALAARYIRLNDFINSGMLPIEKGADLEFISHVSSGKAGSFVFKVPNNEAFAIAKSIVKELVERYALDPKHGVNSYLSLGMRHGTLVDHLRSPLSKHQIITSKSVLGYERAEYWDATFGANGASAIGPVISAEILRFSELYDVKLANIKNDLVQVKRIEKPNGIIDLDWDEVEVLAFMSAFTKVSSLEELVGEFSAFYWTIVDRKLAMARRSVLGEIRDGLLELINNLESSIVNGTGYPRLGPFTDAVVRAKDELDTALNELASWHNLAKSTDNEPIELQDIVLAAQKIVCRLHPEFRPNLEVSGDTHVTLTSSLNILVEVFKALFTNVSEHSGVECPTIEISIDASDPERLQVIFYSSCSKLDDAEQAGQLASQRIASGEYENRLPTEGGSGLPKIARATVSGSRPHTRIWVDREKSMFAVEMHFSIVNL